MAKRNSEELDPWEPAARQLAHSMKCDPDELIEIPGSPIGFLQPRWVQILQRMKESPEEFAKIGLIPKHVLEKYLQGKTNGTEERSEECEPGAADDASRVDSPDAGEP